MLCNESGALDNAHRKDQYMTDLRSARPVNDNPAIDSPARDRYLTPGRTTNVFNSAVAWLARAGVSILGSRELRVRGRRSGEWRTTPVNLLVVDGQRYLVAPRGPTSRRSPVRPYPQTRAPVRNESTALDFEEIAAHAL